MNRLPVREPATSWDIGKDNWVKTSPFEVRQLRGRIKLTERTLHVECPQYPVMDRRAARAIAVLALSDAAIGRCGTILIKGPRWRYEFDTKALNDSIRRRWGKRGGMVQNPAEKVAAGCAYDTTRKLWMVPEGYGATRERVTFGAESPSTKSPVP